MVYLFGNDGLLKRAQILNTFLVTFLVFSQKQITSQMSSHHESYQNDYQKYNAPDYDTSIIIRENSTTYINQDILSQNPLGEISTYNITDDNVQISFEKKDYLSYYGNLTGDNIKFT